MKNKYIKPQWSVTKAGKVIFSGSHYECLMFICKLYPKGLLEDILGKKVKMIRYSAKRNKKSISKTTKKLAKEMDFYAR